MYIITIIIC